MNRTIKPPDKTPMTIKRKAALKKGEYLRAYKGLIGQLHYMHKVAAEIMAMDKTIYIVPANAYLRSAKLFLENQEDVVRHDLDMISKEESEQRSEQRARKRYIKNVNRLHKLRKINNEQERKEQKETETC